MTTERQLRERSFHERRGARELASLSLESELRFRDEQYLDHESWVRPSFKLLGPLEGKLVLDYGGGSGLSTVVLARKGARVATLDIARQMAELARRRAEANGVGERVKALAMAAESLGYRDGVFDAVYGNAILHHVSLEQAVPELFRVMKPGAVAVFSEPLGENPLLEFVRNRIPYPGKERTPTERPLTEKNIALFRAHFGEVELRHYQLLSMVRRLIPWRPLISSLELIDGFLLTLFPRLRRFCRYCVLFLRKADA